MQVAGLCSSSKYFSFTRNFILACLRARTDRNRLNVRDTITPSNEPRPFPFSAQQSHSGPTRNFQVVRSGDTVLRCCMMLQWRFNWEYFYKQQNSCESIGFDTSLHRYICRSLWWRISDIIWIYLTRCVLPILVAARESSLWHLFKVKQSVVLPLVLRAPKTTELCITPLQDLSIKFIPTKLCHENKDLIQKTHPFKWLTSTCARIPRRVSFVIGFPVLAGNDGGPTMSLSQNPWGLQTQSTQEMHTST